MRRRITAAALAVALVLVGCSDGDDEVVTTADDTENTSASGSEAGNEDGTGDEGDEPSGDCRTGEDAASAEEPQLEAPAEKATEMVVTDLIEGCGSAIPEGEVVGVEVNYMGKAHSSGEVFDSSFGGTPAAFPVGAGRLIQGWDEGLVGMKEGGRRQLLIPGDLAYGPMGSPPDIGPDDTLVFVIDLISVQEQ